MSVLIVVSGPPGVGKTTLAKKLQKDLKIPLLSKDIIKEQLFDSLGCESKEEAKKYGVPSIDILYKLTAQYLTDGISVIIESNFRPEWDNVTINEILQRTNAQGIQFYCTGDFDTLCERFVTRVESGERHPGHCDAQRFDKEVYKKEYFDVNTELEFDCTTCEVDMTSFNYDYDHIVGEVKELLT